MQNEISTSQSSAEYWTEHNVTLHEQFSNRQQSLDYLHWRNKQYLFYDQLMPCNGFDNKTVLDYGCGPGHDLVGFIEFSKPSKIIGIDVSSTSLKEAEQRLKLHDTLNKAELILLQEQEKIPLGDDSIDYIHSSGVLHHTPNMEEILLEFYRILKKDGLARIMVYHRDSIWANLYVPYERQILQRIDSDLSFEEAFRKSTDGDNCPISRCFSEDEFNKICKKLGFECKMIGVAISSFEMSLLPKRYDAIQNLYLKPKYRDFLCGLTFDEFGRPLYNGKVAGIDAVFELRKY